MEFVSFVQPRLIASNARYPASEGEEVCCETQSKESATWLLCSLFCPGNPCVSAAGDVVAPT